MNALRYADMQNWAQARGWSYSEPDRPRLSLRGALAWYAGPGAFLVPPPGKEWLRFLPKGEGGQGVSFYVEGSRQGRPVTMAGYWFRVSSMDGPKDVPSIHTEHLNVVVVHLAASYPRMELRPRGAIGRFGRRASRAAGRTPRNLTGDEEFDHRYSIHGDTSLVTPQLISAYLDLDLPPWHLRGHHLVFSWPAPIPMWDFDGNIDQALTVAALLDGPDDFH